MHVLKNVEYVSTYSFQQAVVIDRWVGHVHCRSFPDITRSQSTRAAADNMSFHTSFESKQSNQLCKVKMKRFHRVWRVYVPKRIASNAALALTYSTRMRLGPTTVIFSIIIVWSLK